MLVGAGFGGEVARDVDVDDAAGVDVGREEDGRKLDLMLVSKVLQGNTLCDNVAMRSGTR